MKKILFNLLPIFLLLLVSGVLVYQNYTPGTILSGWDTLHPEFNFGLNLKRLIFGVFRTEQGLGAVAAHSHMTELPRLLFLYLFHFFLPVDALRYSYIFLCLILGPIGMYFFLLKAVIKEKVPSFLGGLFYLLNFGTIQTFAVPFEMFVTMYAYLPFVFLFATNLIVDSKNKIKNFVLFSIFILLMSPSAYAATLWYVFFISFMIYLFVLVLLPSRSNGINEDNKFKVHPSTDGSKFKINKWKLAIGLPAVALVKAGKWKIFFLLLVSTLIINSYWLLPNIYFVKNHGESVENASINKLFSQQAFLKNKEFGQFADILLLKSFYFDWPIFKGNGEFDMILSPFITHLENKPVLTASYLLAAFWLTGVFYSLKNNKIRSMPYFLPLLFSIFFLINANFPFEGIFAYFQKNVPFFREAMRFPGDKILNIAIFIVTIFFAFSQRLFVNFIQKTFKVKGVLPKAFVFFISSILLILVSFPAFQGKIVSPYMKIRIPKAYFELFSYMDKQNSEGKVALFPVHSPWGWSFYNFNDEKYPSFQGAGFLYFGIKQPILERDFDRWSPNNENFYKEISYAVYKNDVNLFANTIKKYNVEFLMVDKNITSIPNPKDLLYFEQTEKLIKNLNMKYEIKKFNKITLYKLADNEQIVEAKPILTNVFPEALTMFRDTAYEHYYEYMTYPNQFEHKNNTVYAFFPFRNIADNQLRLNKNLVSIKDDRLVFNTGKKTKNFYHLTEYENSMATFPSDVFIERKDDQKVEISFYPQIAIFDDKTFSSPISGELTIPTNVQTDLFINQRYSFKLKNLSLNVTYASGKAFLDNQDNNISLYSLENKQKISDIMSKINPIFSYCDKENSASNIRTYVKDNKISLFSNNDICIYIPLDNLISKNILSDYTEILFEQEFAYNGQSILSACTYNFSDSSCSYYPNIEKKGSLSSFSFPVKTNNLKDTAIKLFFKKGKDMPRNEEELTNLNLFINTPYQEALITRDLINKTFLKNDYVQFSRLVVPKNVQDIQTAEVAGVEKFHNDCLGDSTTKKDIVGENNEEIVKYSAEKASFCDYYSYKNLPHKQAFLVFIKSKNESGLPLSVCITNYTSRRCDIYDLLSNFKEFDTDIFLLPPMDENGIGYDVNIENIGIKGSPAVNYLKSIEFVPIPYELLQGIKVENKGLKNLYKEETDAKILQTHEYNPSLISFSVKNPTSRYVVKLNYSYEKGFNAYYLTCDGDFQCMIKSYLVPIFGREIKDHIIINNWSNGWIIDKKLKSNQKIVISYIPQYFEYIGFFLLLIYLLLLLVLIIKRSKKRRPEKNTNWYNHNKNTQNLKFQYPF